MGYSADLTNKQWELIEHIFRAHKGQHFVEHPKRILVNAVLNTGSKCHISVKIFLSMSSVFMI